MTRSYNPQWIENATKYCEEIEKKVLVRREALKESVYLEQFRMLYRYLDREYVFCKENGKSFKENIKNIIEETPMGKSLLFLKMGDMKLSLVEKIQYNMLKCGRYQLCEMICWFRSVYIKLMSR